MVHVSSLVIVPIALPSTMTARPVGLDNVTVNDSSGSLRWAPTIWTGTSCEVCPAANVTVCPPSGIAV
jgi:hypothetical protein